MLSKEELLVINTFPVMMTAVYWCFQYHLLIVKQSKTREISRHCLYYKYFAYHLSFSTYILSLLAYLSTYKFFFTQHNNHSLKTVLIKCQIITNRLGNIIYGISPYVD
jgi:hypothetical protein